MFGLRRRDEPDDTTGEYGKVRRLPKDHADDSDMDREARCWQNAQGATGVEAAIWALAAAMYSRAAGG